MGTLGSIALGVWLVLMGAVQAFDIKFANRDKIMGFLALIAGIIWLIGTLNAMK